MRCLPRWVTMRVLSTGALGYVSCIAMSPTIEEYLATARRTGGAIFQVTVPDTIIRSACRGEALKTSDPKRAMSYREVAVAIISIAQQASPNIAGQSDELRAQFMIVSTPVSRMFCSTSVSAAVSTFWPTMEMVSWMELTDSL